MLAGAALRSWWNPNGPPVRSKPPNVRTRPINRVLPTDRSLVALPIRRKALFRYQSFNFK